MFSKVLLFASFLLTLSVAQQIEPCSSQWVPDLFQLICLDYFQTDMAYVDGRVLAGRLNISNFIVGKGLLGLNTTDGTTDGNTTSEYQFQCFLESNNSDSNTNVDPRDARSYPYTIVGTGTPNATTTSSTLQQFMMNGTVYGGNIGISNPLDQAQVQDIDFEGQNCQVVPNITFDTEIWKVYLRDFESRLAHTQPNGKAVVVDGVLILSTIDTNETNGTNNNTDSVMDSDVLLFRIPMSEIVPFNDFQWNISSNNTFKGYVIDIIADEGDNQNQNQSILMFPQDEKIQQSLLPFANKLLFNSQNLRALQFAANSTFIGTLLAPNATVSVDPAAEDQTLTVWGSLIVNAFNGKIDLRWPKNATQSTNTTTDNVSEPWCWGSLFGDLNAGSSESSKKRSIFSNLFRKNW